MEGLISYKKSAPVNLALIAVNVFVFLWVETHGSSENLEVMVYYGASYAPLILGKGEYWRLLTAAFLHFGIEHIMNNMLFLFLLGDKLEHALGHVKYLIFYLLCAVGANVISLWSELSRGEIAVSAGASGAIFGVIGGLLWAVIRNRGRLEDLTTRQLFYFALLSIVFGFTDSTVDNSAHIGGLFVGFVLSMVLYRKPKNRMNR